MTINKTSYDHVAARWAELRDDSFVSQLVVAFASQIRPQGDVLDVGCGTGAPIARYLSDQGLYVLGLDASHEMIAIARSKGIKNTTFIVSDFFDFGCDKMFDGIIAWDSFFHFPKEKQREIYSKAHDLLKPQGYLIFTHGKKDDEHHGAMFDTLFYYSSLSKETLSDVLVASGFEIEYMYEDFIEQGSHRELVVLARKR